MVIQRFFLVAEVTEIGPTFVGVFDDEIAARDTASITGARVVPVDLPSGDAWQLYNIGGHAHAASALTLLLAVSMCRPTVGQAFSAWCAAAEHLSIFGATDTEGRDVAREALRAFYAINPWA